MSFLPIGSIVKLYNGRTYLMVLNRFPLYNENGQIGYFEYSGTTYPLGKLEEQVYYFNHDNIDEVIFEGFVNEDEENLQKYYKTQLESIQYPKFQIEN